MIENKMSLYTHMEIGIKAIVEYLQYLGVNYVNVTQRRQSELGITVTFSGECTSEEWKYFSPFCRMRTISQYPMFKKEAMFGSRLSDMNFSIFEYEEKIQFDFDMSAYRVENINEFFKFIKNNTEDLRLKRFNEAFDKEVEEELDSSKL